MIKSYMPSTGLEEEQQLCKNISCNLVVGFYEISMYINALENRALTEP